MPSIASFVARVTTPTIGLLLRRGRNEVVVHPRARALAAVSLEAVIVEAVEAALEVFQRDPGAG